MNAIPFLVLLVVLATGFVFVLRQQKKIIAGLQESRDEIEGEERRLFDFLHGLGTELQKDYSSANMHRYIVDGIIRVLEADGAALYLVRAKKNILVPAYVSNNCPPLIALPDSVLAEPKGEKDKPSRLTSYIRLQSIAADHPVYGKPLTTRKTLRIDDLASEPAFKEAIPELHAGVSLMIGPLIYAGEPLGLLMVAHQSHGPSFSDNDVAVFNSLTEQSAFALGSAMIHKEAHDKRLLDAELRNARECQRILLPNAAPVLASYDIAGVNYPAKTVSGDYYDYVQVDDHHIGVAIADVSGKGVPASLIMAMCRSVLRAKAGQNLSPADVLKVVNSQIFPDIREDMFISMVYLILNGQSDEVTIARAGHNPPLLFRWQTGQIEAVKPKGMAVGIDSGGVFDRVISDFQFALAPGDLLLLYTDGVSEAINAAGEEFGEERIKESLRMNATLTAQAFVARLYDEVRTFSRRRTQSDDITLIAIKKG